MSSTDATPNFDERLPSRLLEALAKHGGTRTFPSGAILINEGDSTASTYIVLQGRVKAYASDEHGREVVLGEFGPGEYLGEMMLDGHTRSASVKALTPARLTMIRRGEFEQILGQRPDIAFQLI